MTSRPAPASMTGLDWAMLIALGVLWGGSFLFAKVAVAEVPPMTLVFFRVALAALSLYVVMRIRGIPFIPATQWPAYMVMAIINNVIPFSLLFYGQTQIGAGLASILNATTPFFALAVAHVFTEDDRISGGRLVGILLGIAGVAVLVGVDALQDIGAQVWAQIACLGAALSYGFAVVFGRRFRGDPPIASAAGQVTASSFLMLPIIAVVDMPWTLPMPSTPAIVSVVLLGTISTALAYILYFRILKSAGATNLSLVTLLVPVTAVLFGALLLGERLGTNDMAGMVLIGLGLAAIDGRPHRWFMRVLGFQRPA